MMRPRYRCVGCGAPLTGPGLGGCCGESFLHTVLRCTVCNVPIDFTDPESCLDTPDGDLCGGCAVATPRPHWSEL